MAGKHNGSGPAMVFDLFDTLVGVREGELGAARERTAHRLGVEAAELSRVWAGLQSCRYLGHIGTLPEMFLRVGEGLGVAVNPGLARILAQEEQATLARAAYLYDDVAGVLDQLKAKAVPMAILSNASAWVEHLYQSLHLEKWITTCLWSCFVGLVKPDPRFYGEAAAQLGRLPSQCLFVGDGAFNELEGARQAGMQALRIARPTSPSAAKWEWKGPEIRIMDELLPWAGIERR